MANHRARREAKATINEFADDHLIRPTDLQTEEKSAIESISRRAARDAGRSLGRTRCRARRKGAAASSRQTVTDHFRKLVEQLLGASPEPWPTTAQRFEQIGLAIDYTICRTMEISKPTLYNYTAEANA